MMKSTFPALILFTFIALLLVGCNDGEQLKLEVQEAMQQQQHIENYRFSGNAEFLIDHSLPSMQANPLTASLLAMFMQSKLSWSGTAENDPVRLEIDLQITPQGSAQTLELPLIINHNKLYFNIPAINQEAEYFMIDMDLLAVEDQESNPLSPKSLQHAGQLSAAIVSSMVDVFEAKWFKYDKAASNKESGLRTITVVIDQDNVQQIAAAILDELPSIIDEVHSAGFISADKANAMEQSVDNDHREQLDHILAAIVMDEPGLLSVTINEDGYVTNQLVDLNYHIAAEDGNLKKYRIHLDTSLEEINQHPDFIKEIPQRVKPFNDVLNLLNGQTK